MTPTGKSCAAANDETHIRDCTLGDAAAIAEIYNEHIQLGSSSMDNEIKSVAHIEAQISGFNDREIILVLEQAEEILGWGIIKRYSDRGGYRFACETSVYLRARETRKGYGPRIKKALIRRCKEYGYHHLVAKLLATNESSFKYNSRLGFEVVGRQRQVGFRNGKWQDMLIMQLILDDVPPFLPDQT